MSEISKQSRDVDIRFRNFADVMPAMIKMSGVDQRCDYVNKGWLRFTGRRLEEEVGYGWIEGVHPDDLEQCRAAFLEAFESRQSFRIRYRLRRHDGLYRWILDDGTPRFTRNGIFSGYIGAGFDVHEEHDWDGRLRDVLAEKDRLLTIVNAPMQEVRLRINNSLQLVSSFLMLQSSRSGDPHVAEEFRSCLMRIHSIGLVHDLLYSSESPTILLEDYLRHLCSRLLDALEAEQRIALTLDVEPAMFDTDTMVQVALIVSEVLTGAVKYAIPEGRQGSIALTFRCRNGKGLLSITDDGIGYRAKSEPAGAYGLELVRILAERIKGTARHLQGAGGSRFQLEFPLAQSAQVGRSP